MSREPPGPGEGTAVDPFEEATEAAQARREELAALRRDVEALVRDEVRRTGIGEERLREMVAGWARQAAAEEIARRAPTGGRPRPLTRPAPALLAVGFAIGALLGVGGYALWRADAPAAGSAADGGPAAPGDLAPATDDEGSDLAGGPAGDSASGAGAPADGAGSGAAAPEPASPTELAARFDSLWQARSERFDPMLARLEAADPAPPVRAALATWRAGTPLDAAATRRLHDALVQLALNETRDAGLVLDGLVSRGPCRGNSCGALLELWRERTAEPGMPELPADPANDTSTLAVVEKSLLLGRLGDG